MFKFLSCKGQVQVKLDITNLLLILSCYSRMQWLDSDAVVAELVDSLGSGSSVHWTWEFESPRLPPTIQRMVHFFTTSCITDSSVISTHFPISLNV